VDGDYNVIATDVNGCEAEAVVFGVHTDVATPESAADVSIFPDPVTDKFSVKIRQAILPETGNLTACIYNITGSIQCQIDFVVNQRSAGWQTAGDVSGIPPGMYVLEIKSGEHSFRSKFVKAARD
jgi:hypothetical protein